MVTDLANQIVSEIIEEVVQIVMAGADVEQALKIVLGDYKISRLKR